jgi:arylsulfatase
VKDNSLEIELYDLENDPQEQVNLASSNVDIISRMEEIFSKEHSKSVLERFQMPALGD